MNRRRKIVVAVMTMCMLLINVTAIAADQNVGISALEPTEKQIDNNLYQRTYTITKRASPYRANAVFKPYATYAESSYVMVDLKSLPDTAIVKKMWVECKKSTKPNPYFLLYDYHIWVANFDNGRYEQNWEKASMVTNGKTQIFGHEFKNVKDAWYIKFDCKNLTPIDFAAATLSEFKMTVEYTK